MLLLLGGSYGLDVGGEEVGNPYNVYLLLSDVTLNLLFISNFKRYKYPKFVKLRRLHNLLNSVFPLGSYIPFSPERTDLVPLFLVFLRYNFKGLLSLKKVTGFDPREMN